MLINIYKYYVNKYYPYAWILYLQSGSTGGGLSGGCGQEPGHLHELENTIPILNLLLP